MADELWENIGGSGSTLEQPWPAYDEAMLKKDEIEIAVQISGKVRAKMNVPSGLDKAGLEEYVRGTEGFAALTEGKDVIKFIAVPGKLVNIVTK
jgi:leucyl-tRNA synthetase